jgi:outer membrane protein assembly factor BamB
VRSTAAISNGLAYFGSGDENLYAIDAKTGKERWHFKTGGAVTSSPAVAASVVFFTSRDGILYALNASDGKAIWKFQMGKDLPYENGGTIIFHHLLLPTR